MHTKFHNAHLGYYFIKHTSVTSVIYYNFQIKHNNNKHYFSYFSYFFIFWVVR